MPGIGDRGGLAEAIRQAIRDSGLPLVQIAAGSGVDDGILSRFMRAERSLTLDTADRLVSFLGVRVLPPDRPPVAPAEAPAPATISKRK